MRDESEIVAMRDRLHRREIAPHGEELNDVVLGTLRWVCDPSRSDREVLDLAETDLAEGMTLTDALEFLTDPGINWNEVAAYLGVLTAKECSDLGVVAMKLGGKCSESTKTKLAATG